MGMSNTGMTGEMYVEHFANNILGYETLMGDNEEKWDRYFETLNGVDIKTQPEMVKYGGVSIEIAECNPTKYNKHKKTFLSSYKGVGKWCYPTGLKTSECDYYAFTDLNSIYFINTSILKEMTVEYQYTRWVWGGNNGTSLQWQLKMEELQKYSTFSY